MYHVTLVNLASDARRADADLGASKSRLLSPDELRALLETFREIDALQNAAADPEIQIHNRGARYVVRTGQGRLLFSDARDTTQPTITLSTAEILAELDGSAAAARSRPPFPMSAPSEIGRDMAREGTKVAVMTPAKRRFRVIVLSAAAVLLLGGIVALSLPRGVDPEPEITPLASGEVASTARMVEGVYVTGGEPGDRGIVVGGDGRIRIFELNVSGAPSFVHGTWQAGRIDGALCLAVPQLRTIVTVIDRQTVTYCGERYRRAASL